MNAEEYKGGSYKVLWIVINNADLLKNVVARLGLRIDTLNAIGKTKLIRLQQMLWADQNYGWYDQ